MAKYIVFADHEIGYDLLQDLFCDSSSIVDLVVTTRSNESSWWPSISTLNMPSDVILKIYDYGLDDIIFDNVDYVLLLSWKYILKRELLNRISVPIINLHYSLLPKFRGSYPVNWALLTGEIKTGVTFHLVNEGVDSGGILLQGEISIQTIDTARSLQLKLDMLARKLFSELILNIHELRVRNNKITNTLANTKADFSNKMSICLDENYSGENVFNIIRAACFPHNPQEINVIDKSGDIIFSFTVTNQR